MNAPLIRLAKADAVVIDGVAYMERHRTKTSLTLSTVGGETVRTFTADELRDLYFDPNKRMKIIRGHLAEMDPDVAREISRPFESFSEEQQIEMLRRLDHMTACDRFFSRKLYSKRPDKKDKNGKPGGYARIAQIVARYRRLVAKKYPGRIDPSETFTPVSGSALREWYGRWRQSGRSLGALAPLTHHRGSKKKRLDPAVRKVIAQVVNETWLTMEAPPVTVTHGLVCHRIDKLNLDRISSNNCLPPLDYPSEMAVRRWIKENTDSYTRTFHRKGRKAADHDHRLVKRAPVPTRPLQIVEFDDTPLDIIIVDDRGKPQGRAILTAGVCLATGMTVGWHIGLEAPSWVTVMQALRMAVLKKDVGDSGAISPYPVFGLPEMIKVDNGAPYRSTSLVAAAAQLNFELRLVPAGKPHLKGKVERFFLEVARDFFSLASGRTFGNVRQRGDYDSEGNALLTLAEVNRMFMRWLVDIHHLRPNSRTFGQAPLDRWEALSGLGVRLPPEAVDLAPLIGRVIKRTIVAEGITFMGLTYSGPELKTIRKSGRHLGNEWMVKVDPLNIEQVLVLDEEEMKWIAIDCQQPDLVAGLSLSQWMTIVDNARRHTAERQRVRRSTLYRAREFLLNAGGTTDRKRPALPKPNPYMDHMPNDKMIADFEISIVPDEDAPASIQAHPKQRARKRKIDAATTKKTADAVSAGDPTITLPASMAGGHPVVHHEVAGADIDESRRKLETEGEHEAELPLAEASPPIQSDPFASIDRVPDKSKARTGLIREDDDSWYG